MPNIIELNLLSNKSIVATMQGIPLANENSYKIIAGEENATIFKVVSVPNQYKDKNFTIEMVNAKNYGINETQIKNISNYEFSLPVGMAVAGYSYILFRCKYTENGKQVVVPFQPLKVKVWNTIPQWQDYVDKTTNAKVVDGYLILTENGNEYNLGYVQGEKGDAGKDGKDHSVEIAEIKSDIADLYLLSNATVTGTEEIKEAYTARQTANGLSGLIDGALTKVLKVEGNTVRTLNEFDISKIKNETYIYPLGNNIVAVSTYGHPLGGTVKDIFPNVKANVIYTCACTITQDADSTASNGMIVVRGGSTNSRLVNAHSIGKAGERAYKKKTVVFTEEDLSKYVYVYGLQSGTMVWENFMLVEGDYSNTDMPAFQPYFTGLKNASFKGITSTGKNLLRFPYSYDSQTINGITFTVNRDGTITANGTATDTSIFYLNGATQERMVVGQSYTISDIRGDGYYTRVLYTENGVYKEASNSSFMFTVKPSYCSIEIRISAGTTLNNVVFKPMLNFGDTALPYEPYEEDTLELPTAVECGLGTTIDLENRKIINRGVEITLTGAEIIEYRNYKTESYAPNVGSLPLYTLHIEAKLPTVEKRAYGITTDGIVATQDDTSSQWKDGALWLGVGNQTLYWVNALEYLGLYNVPEYPTETQIEEAKTTLATYLKQRYESGNPVKIRYISNIPEELPLSTNKSKYKAWVGGSETVVQGTTDNSKYGAENTATNIYAIKKGVTE